MKSDEGHIILLPHPGEERFPNESNFCDWPKRQGHRRKFMRLYGEWVNIKNRKGANWLEMWTEYEAPTLTERLEGSAGLPKYVHEISYTIGMPKLNTDPWIFDPGFIWTICRHGRAGDVKGGDIVLFGSSLDNQWVVDTVFVVDRRLDQVSERTFSEEYRGLVLSTLQINRKPLHPFIGKPFRQGTSRQITSPFSFVPCKNAEDSHAPFKRLSINKLLKDLRKLSDGERPSVKNAQALVRCAPVNGLSRFWVDLLNEVHSQGLLMGVTFEHPGVEITGSAKSRSDCSPVADQRCA